jgi:hypothetical protein
MMFLRGLSRLLLRVIGLCDGQPADLVYLRAETKMLTLATGKSYKHALRFLPGNLSPTDPDDSVKDTQD